MADAGAGIDIVVAEAGADQFLDEEGFLIRAARGGDPTNCMFSIVFLDASELGGGVADRLLPANHLPGFVHRGADHRLQHPLAVRCIAPGEAAFYAGVAAIGLAILPWHHAYELFTLHLRLEGAADATIGAGRDLGPFGLPDLLHRLFLQRAGRAGLDAGAAGDAFGGEEGLVLAGRDAAVEAAAGNGERERTLHFVARPHAARADDAQGRVEIEIGIGAVAGRAEMLRDRQIPVARRADHRRHLLHLSRFRGRRMVGEIELHHALAQALQPVALGHHGHAFGDRRGAGGGRARPAVNLDQAEAAGAEALQAVGRAELRD